jgi:hypothetical protein
LTQTREFVESLHSVILENNQKLMGFSIEGMEEFVEEDFSNMNTEIVDESQLGSIDEITGMNLKAEIDNQLNNHISYQYYFDFLSANKTVF